MKIVLKTLKREAFELEVNLDDTISIVKDKIEAKFQHPKSHQKLIHAGKILDNEKTVGWYSIKENDFLVMLIQKPKEEPKEPEKKEPPAPVSAPTTTAPTTSTPSTQTSSQVPATEGKSPATAQQTSENPSPAPSGPTSGPADNIPTGPALESMINQIVEMGFPRNQVLMALRASFNHPERAIEYLMNGLPQGAMPIPSGNLGGNPSVSGPPSEGSQIGSSVATPTATTPPTSESTEGSGVFNFLRQHPQFNSLRMLLRSNPAFLQPVIQQLASINPQIVDLITQHQDEFIRLLHEPLPPDTPGMPDIGNPPGTGVRIQITQEEKNAIDRLSSLGFDRNKVIEAYFACDKDEQLAANYLLEHGFDEDLDPEQNN